MTNAGLNRNTHGPKGRMTSIGGALGVGLLIACQVPATANLISNGDFELGNVGFVSDYVFSPGNLVPEGRYDVVLRPCDSHALAACFGDHTTGNGRMAAFNGGGSNNARAWSQSVAVQPNQTYEFSGWAASWGQNNFNGLDQSPARLSVSINGSSVGADVQLPAASGQWTPFQFDWNSGFATLATIQIVDVNTASIGNDFAIDDLSFVPEPAALTLMLLVVAGSGGRRRPSGRTA